jgi:hypothetical protein
MTHNHSLWRYQDYEHADSVLQLTTTAEERVVALSWRKISFQCKYSLWKGIKTKEIVRMPLMGGVRNYPETMK